MRFPSLQCRLLPVVGAALVLAACSDTTSVAGPALQPTRSTAQWTGGEPGGGPGRIGVCSVGGTSTFTVAASPATGTLLGGGSFSVADNSCVDAWTATPGDATITTVTVAQTSSPFDSVTATAIPSQTTPQPTVDQSTRTVVFTANADHGGGAIFYQAVLQPPPPPPPRKLVVCKEGPAGSYSFTVSATGSGSAFPSGASFTVAAGECKDVWQRTSLGVIPDPDVFVTVTEVGTAPLDSIEKDLEYEPATMIIGTRTVVSRVNYFHGGVLTYFNAFPPPVAATCTSITATRGTAITPVQMGASGGTGGPYTFTASGLPAGLTLSTSGLLSGTPTVTGSFTYTIVATDNQGNTGTTSCAVTVNDAPPPPPTGTQGCTPGYWKVKQHWDSWSATGYTTTQAISTVFSVPASLTVKNEWMGSYSLVNGLSFKGGSTLSGKAEILLRAAIAGLLNSSNGNIDYFYTTATLISSVNAALNGGDGAAMVALAARIDMQNNKGCPLN